MLGKIPVMRTLSENTLKFQKERKKSRKKGKSKREKMYEKNSREIKK